MSSNYNVVVVHDIFITKPLGIIISAPKGRACAERGHIRSMRRHVAWAFHVSHQVTARRAAN